MKHTLIFANGDLNNGIAVQRTLEQPFSFVIAADGGGHMALELGYPISLIIGDMDSIHPDVLRDLARDGAEVMRFPAEKDETDLELALLEAAKRGAESIRVVGGLGGRLDQTLANLYLLNLSELDGLDVQIVSGAQTIWVLHPGQHSIMGTQRDTISLIPLGGDAKGIVTYDLKYSLRNETLVYGPARGVSNVIVGQAPRLHFDAGRLLVIHTVGRA